MRKSLLFLIVFTVIFSLGAGGSEPTAKLSIKKLHWLKGKWSRVAAGVEHFEIWHIKQDSLLEGESYYDKPGKKKVTEKMSIKWLGKDLVYIADVAENEAPVQFKNILLNDSVAVFENRSHDYPNRITYLKESKRSFHVILDNNSGTKTRKLSFKLVTKR